MTVPLTTSGPAWESSAWQELENVFAALAQLARSPVAPHVFYRSLLEQCTQALAGTGGAVWLRSSNGNMQPIAHMGWLTGESLVDEAERDAHESLLRHAATQGHVVCIPPRATLQGSPCINSTEHALLLAPIHVATPAIDNSDPEAAVSTTADHSRTTIALVELLLPADSSPARLRGSEQFLTAICELAADYHAFTELRCLRRDEQYRDQLLKLGRQVHRETNLSATAFAVVNEGRNVVGCDRLSVLVTRGRGCRLLATSGASRIERRGTAARGLEKLGELVRKTDEPAYYTDGQSDALPPVAAALEQHAEQSEARQIAAVPVPQPVPARPDHEERSAAHRRSKRPLFVLIAEQFDARDGELNHERLLEVAEVCATALNNALEYERLPFLWLLRPLGAVKRQVSEHLPRTALVIAAVAAMVAALVLVPAEFHIETTGTLQPVVKRDIFAPRSGLVEQVLVSHGEHVAAGQELVRLRDPALDLELKRVDGEWETAQRQLDAVRATRTNRAIRDANPADAYRLSAEEQQLEQRLANLQREMQLLYREREQLVVASPIAGRVLTWDVAPRLSARPVERGEALLTVADLSGPWQLELEVPDDRLGYLLAASKELQPALPVRFRLGSDDRERHTGHIVEISQMADLADAERSGATPTALVKVALDSLELSDQVRRDLRPGISARAQIACGKKSLGYVWLHDIWNTVLEWLRF